MKLVFILLAAISLTITTHGQSLKKYPISSSGCSAYMFCDPVEFEMSYSEDSTQIFTGECIQDSVHYGIICVKLKEPSTPGQEAEDLMIAYIDYLKKAFEISYSVGYGKGHVLKGKEDVRGVIDYWKDRGGNEWKIKGWTDGKFIALLYAHRKNKLDENNRVNIFLDGFRFPGM